MRRSLLVLAAGLAFAVPAGAATTLTAPVYDAEGRLVDTPFAPQAEQPRLDEQRALALALAHPKVRDWVSRYPDADIVQEATFDDESRRWTVKVWAGDEAGQIVLARVSDDTGRVREAWTGPQVAWTMARGYDGAFGRKINDPAIWFGLTALFLVGLAHWRRPLCLHNLDLLVLVSFSASLWFFNRGEVFTAMPLVYPPLVYLLLRMGWIGLRGRRDPAASRPIWPVWLLAVATLFTLGFRIGLNLERSNVIDVGYAGVIGASRILHDGQSPYGHFPVRRGEECGRADVNGVVRDRIQANGRCESSNDRGDTYGPVAYLAYVPGVVAFGWSGRWDALPAAHFTAILFDVAALAALAAVGWRLGRTRLAVALAFAWVSYPFTQYASSSNSNDAIVPALLLLGFLAAVAAPARGLFLGLAAWAKFAPLVLVPLWWTYRAGRDRTRSLAAFAGGFAVATVLAFWVLLLEPSPGDAARTFWDRTFGFQLGRESPFSIWDWGRYGYPDLGIVQTVVKVLLVIAALAAAIRPRRKGPLQLAALTAALLIGFELTLTHWFYLYIPWFFPFVAIALLLPVRRPRPSGTAEPVATPDATRALVAS